MFNFFLLATRAEFRERFVSVSGLVLELVTLVLSLTVYWYTAKAFAPAFGQGMSAYDNYFSFILLGEIVLLVPITLLEGVSRSLRKCQTEGTLEYFQFVSPRSFVPPILLVFARLPRELLRVGILVVLAILLFGFRLGPAQLGGLFLLQLLTLPAFLSIGILGAALFLFLGRGEHLLLYLGTTLMAVAGAYFPVSVLPPEFAAFANAVSPYSLLMNASRELMSGGWQWSLVGKPLSILVLEGVALLPVSLFLFSRSALQVKKRGSAFLVAR